MNVWAIMATCGRHTLAERSLGMFLQQDYKGPHTLLIHNNSEVELNLEYSDFPEGKRVRLFNCSKDLKTGKKYTNLGAIYRDALTQVQPEADALVHWDDDDLFLENHISEGVKGLKRGSNLTTFSTVKNYIAYKPAKSYYRHAGGIELMSNTLEPSIFVEADHIKKHGYSLTTTDQHLQWVNPLVYENRIFVDETGPATLIYNWGDRDIPTFKTSGDGGNPDNFDNYRNFSKDHGDRILTPWTKEELQKYYNLVK